MACEKGTMLREWLPKQLEANHDLTLEERREAFEEHFGVEVSTSTVERAIAALPDGGWPLKKVVRSLRAQGGSEEPLAVVGFPLRCEAAGVLKDESGFHTSMRRLRAGAPKGKRAYGKVPRNRGKNTTVVAAITLQGAMGASMILEGSRTRRPSKPTWSASSRRSFARDTWW